MRAKAIKAGAAIGEIKERVRKYTSDMSVNYVSFLNTTTCFIIISKVTQHTLWRLHLLTTFNKPYQPRIQIQIINIRMLRPLSQIYQS